MKKALDSFLAGGDKPAADAGAPAPGPGDFASMFGDKSQEEQDPLAEALQAAGYDVDPAKLDQVRAILDATSEGEAKPLAGMETPDEESLEPGGGGGAVPAAMSMKAGRKY